MINNKLENVRAEAPPLWSIIRYIIASFILIQIFGVFGIFIALAYPLWWFFFPQKTLCFYCLHASYVHPQSTCPACKRKIETVFDPPFRSVIINVITILVLSIFAAMIVFVEAYVIFRNRLPHFLTFQTSTASFVIPVKSNYPYGQDFYIDITVENPSIPINVVQADMRFDPTMLSVRSIETKHSFATIFTQTDYSNTDGWIRITGGIPNPGFYGSKALFSRIYFTPRSIGATKITFLPTSRILANDGKGTNILYSFTSTPLIISR